MLNVINSDFRLHRHQRITGKHFAFYLGKRSSLRSKSEAVKVHEPIAALLIRRIICAVVFGRHHKENIIACRIDWVAHVLGGSPPLLSIPVGFEHIIAAHTRMAFGRKIKCSPVGVNVGSIFVIRGVDSRAKVFGFAPCAVPLLA